MKLGLIQVKGGCGERRAFAQVLSRIRAAAAGGAGVVVLPELFLHRYFPQTKAPSAFELAHTLKTPEISNLRELAGALKIVLVIPFFEKQRKGVYYNSCAVFDADGSELGVYRKMHLPHDPGFYEKFYFSQGNLGFKIFSTRYGRIGVLICFDQWFPEAARLTAMRGCDIIVCPTAIGWDRRELEKLKGRNRSALKKDELSAWKSVQRGHAIANGVFWAAVNRVGREDNLDFWGHSFACGPFGRELGELGSREQGCLLVDCDLKSVKKVRRTWTFRRNRRPDAYEGLLKGFGE